MKLLSFSIILSFMLFVLFPGCSSDDTTGGEKKDLLETAPEDVVAMFLSDFHAGENYGAVSRKPAPQIKADYDSVPAVLDLYYHKKINELMEKLDSVTSGKQGKTIPYLVLMGDIFDLAVHESSDAFNLSHDFFNSHICKGRSFISYFDTIIYLPGNHDHHAWKMLQEEHYIEKRLAEGVSALPFPHQLISVLDLSSGAGLRSVDNNLISSDPGGNMVSGILSDNSKVVHIVYPNLYIRYGNDATPGGICVTHGHFFEPNWNKDTTQIPSFPDVNKMHGYFRNVERYNSPFTEFSDYSIAQVDDTFTDGITDAQFEDQSKMPAKEYAMTGYELSQQYPEFFPLELHEKPLTDIEKLKAHPYQVSNYLYQAYRQMQENDMHFAKLVYGHTHVPCYNQVLPFGAFSEGVPQPPEWASQLVDIYNTGGWVNINDSSTLDIDNTTVKSPNPMFLHKNGTISKVL